MAPRTKLSVELASLRCRTYGHAWDEWSRPDLPTVPGWRLSLRCTRCTTERHDVIDLIGNLSERRYIYPDGYKEAWASDHKMSRPEFRQALYERFRRQHGRGAA